MITLANIESNLIKAEDKNKMLNLYQEFIQEMIRYYQEETNELADNKVFFTMRYKKYFSDNNLRFMVNDILNTFSDKEVNLIKITRHYIELKECIQELKNKMGKV